MKFFSMFLCTLCAILSFSTSFAESEDEAAQALRDVRTGMAMLKVQTGMAMLKEAGSNPALLAQMMQDIQNPELMAEAQKMKNPQFMKQLKELMDMKEYKESIKKSKDAMKDPNTAAKTEAKTEHMLKRGQDDLKKAAGGMMEEAMADMANPEVRSQMTQMMKDPNFKKHLAAMTKDPSFKNYIDAMQDMMKDPNKKQRFEQMSEAVRKEL